jgi:hypothetical protein
MENILSHKKGWLLSGYYTIAYMGSSSFKTPDAIVQLKNILHCPNAATNLLSINRFVEITTIILNSLTPTSLSRTISQGR